MRTSRRVPRKTRVVLAENGPGAIDERHEGVERSSTELERPAIRQDLASMTDDGEATELDRRRALGPTSHGGDCTGLRLAVSGEAIAAFFESSGRARPRQIVGMVPPSITYSLPVIDAARSEARKATSSATSAGHPGRPSGIPPSDFINCSRAAFASVPELAASRSISAVAAVVCMKPGATLTTRMPFGPTSFD